MKKTTVAIIAVLCIVCISMAVLVGCDKGDKSPAQKISGVEGFEGAVIDNKTNTITFDVDCLTGGVSLSKFKTSGGGAVKAYYNAAKTRAVEGDELPLEFGDNIFYIEIVNKSGSAKSKSITTATDSTTSSSSGVVTYRVIISRERPETVVDENKTVKSIEVAQAKNTYYVGESFSQGVLKVTYEDDSFAYVLLTSDMVNGFNTATKGEYTLVIAVDEASVLFDIKVVDITVPNYSQSTAAQLDANLFANTVCEWLATIFSFEARSKFYQEEYNLKYAHFKANFYDDLCAIADGLAKSGLSTKTLSDINKYAKPFLTDIRAIMSECELADGPEAMINTILNADRLKRMGNNAKSVIALIKPEYIATFMSYNFDDALKAMGRGPEFDFGELASSAEKAGLSEIAQLLKDKDKEFDDSQYCPLLLDYNTYAFTVETLFKIIDVVFSSDIDKLCSAGKCIFDMISTVVDGDGNIEGLLSGNSNYSFNEMMDSANIAGKFLTNFVDSVDDLPILKTITLNLMYKLAGKEMADMVDPYLDFDLLKVVGVLLRDLTANDVVKVYANYNDWSTACKKERPEDECDAKLAAFVVSAAKLVDSALDQAKDREGVINSFGMIFSSFRGSVLNVSKVVALIDKATSIENVEDMTEEDNKQIIELYNSCLSSGESNDDAGLGILYLNGSNTPQLVKLGTTKAEFVEMFKGIYFYRVVYDEKGNRKEEPLALTADNVIAFDTSSTGRKSAMLVWGSLSTMVEFYVYSSDTKNQLRINYLYGGYNSSERSYAKDSIVSVNDNVIYNLSYEFIDPTSMFAMEICASECENLSIVGLDTSKVGEGVAYVVGEHEFMGKMVFPFRYEVYEDINAKAILSCELKSYKLGYMVGDKFDGYLDIDYYNNHFNLIDVPESVLSYDFSTPGYKTVTCTLQGKQYTCGVFVYSEDYAKEVDDIAVYYSSDDYLKAKGSSSEFIFIGGYIKFNAINDISLFNKTIGEVRAELKAIDSAYDITLSGYNTNQKAGAYYATVKITRGGEVVAIKRIQYRVFEYDELELDEIEVYCIGEVDNIEGAQVGYVKAYDNNLDEVYLDGASWAELLESGCITVVDYERNGGIGHDSVWYTRYKVTFTKNSND